MVAVPNHIPRDPGKEKGKHGWWHVLPGGFHSKGESWLQSSLADRKYWR